MLLPSVLHPYANALRAMHDMHPQGYEIELAREDDDDEDVYVVSTVKQTATANMRLFAPHFEG